MGGVLAAALLPCGLTPRTHTCVCVHRPKDLTQIDQSNEPNKPHAQPSSTATAARWRGRPSGEGSSSCGPWCVYLVVPVPLCLSFVLGAYTAKDCSCCCCLGVQAGARIYPVCLASVQSNPIQRPLPPPNPPKKKQCHALQAPITIYSAEAPPLHMGHDEYGHDGGPPPLRLTYVVILRPPSVRPPAKGLIDSSALLPPR